MLISRLVPPTSETEPTPRTFSRRFLSTWSAQLVSSTGSMARAPPRVSGSTASDQIGRLAGSKRSTRGSLTSARKVGRTDATFSRTSSAALRPSTCSWNSMTTSDWPSKLREVRALMPAMEFTASSIRLLTSLSTISGEAPGYSVCTTTTGNSILGNWSMLRRWYENTPSTTMAAITIVANTGFFRETRVNHIGMAQVLGTGGLARSPARGRRLGGGCPRELDQHPFTQRADVPQDHVRPWAHPLDRDPRFLAAVAALARLHRLVRHLPVLHHLHIG